MNTLNKTIIQQKKTESLVKKLRKKGAEFEKAKHIDYALRFFSPLNDNSCFSSSRPLFIFWVFQSLSLLDLKPPFDKNEGDRKFHDVCTIKRYFESIKENGVFGGSYGMLPDVANTFASVLSLASTGSEDALDCIDRKPVYKFLLRMKNKQGYFSIHENGEADIRGTYSSIAVASLLGILTPELKENVCQWVSSCQTYEGGFGSREGEEAHGGYTYCALATLYLLDEPFSIDIKNLMSWIAKRQMDSEGGFQGRTNKLVDSCYSFWVGSLFPLLRLMISNGKIFYGLNDKEKEFLIKGYNGIKEFVEGEKVIDYLLNVCQRDAGSFVDRPRKFYAKTGDIMHTFYSICGLSIFGHEEFQKRAKIKNLNVIFGLSAEDTEKVKKYFSSLGKFAMKD